MVRRMTYRKLGQGWRAWRGAIARSKRRRELKYRAARHLTRALHAKAFGAWRAWLQLKQETRHIEQRCVCAMGRPPMLPLQHFCIVHEAAARRPSVTVATRRRVAQVAAPRLRAHLQGLAGRSELAA